MSRGEAIEIARSYAHKSVPGFDVSGLPWGSWEEKKVWVVKFIPHPQALGGALTVVIDKRDKEVLAGFAEQ